MGKKTIEDNITDVNKSNQILKVYITTKLEIDNNQNKSKENIIKEKKIKI